MAFNIDEYQKILFPYAYNILGNAEDAKDIIQDTMIKWQNVDHAKVENEKSYLIRSVINAAINFKDKQKERLSDYPGDWLPEPVHLDTEMDRRHILSYSLLVLLEQLTAKERAIFILKESFDFSHAEISKLLNISVENCRQILKRSKQRLNPSITPSAEKNETKLKLFVEAMINGNAEALQQMLTNDIKAVSDGGKEVSAIRKAIFGPKNVRKLLLGIYEKFYKHSNVKINLAELNHQPALLYTEGQAIRLCQVFQFSKTGTIERIYFVRNPEKLKNLTSL
ncbi:sigma-70 family RNA polymerase sigma factor [Fulvivirga sp. 29W222]|uniref:Sigma-70 family RNA polymerase sigma factor n=1 Tax=Fulvivirga marina TaxID=2494733 RepID=A0A937G0T9_9BACT|nr:sigma-70 family RNA polymerase sigma factor [Fulvivirga marina]MBL6448013.1 sigma-70 family RNA polymerase sigma factor [Fulvivirga marina]